MQAGLQRHSNINLCIKVVHVKSPVLQAGMDSVEVTRSQVGKGGSSRNCMLVELQESGQAYT